MQDSSLDFLPIWRRHLVQVVEYGLEGYYIDTPTRRRTAPQVEHFSVAMYIVATLAFLEGRYGQAFWNGITATPSVGQVRCYTEDEFVILNRVRNALVHTDGDLSRIDRPLDAEQEHTLSHWQGFTMDDNKVVTLTTPALDHVSKMFLGITQAKDGWRS